MPAELNDLTGCFRPRRNFNLFDVCVCALWSKSPIFSCVGNKPIADLLLRNGGNPNAIERDGSTALHRAALRGRLMQLEYKQQTARCKGGRVYSGDLNVGQ